MNVTLSIDGDLVQRCREIAREQGLSLNELIRRYLRSVAGEVPSEQTVAELQHLWRESAGRSGGRKIEREEAYEGRI